MKTWKITLVCAGIAGIASIPVFYMTASGPSKIPVAAKPPVTKKTPQPEGCVFKTIFGEESSEAAFVNKTPAKVLGSIEKGLDFIAKAQHNNGGWGAGLSSRQDIRDPHAVHTDPATTSMVAMALMRSGSTLTQGAYKEQLQKGLNYILNAVEKAPAGSTNITSEVSTQIQVKLGSNIDVILSAQFLSNILDYTGHDEPLKERVKKCLDLCVKRIEKAQDANGSFKGSGWAGVLQSSLATTALESAQANGIAVDSAVLNQAYTFSNSNFDAESGNVNTSMGAGVVLYSVSSTARNSAKQTRKVNEEMEKAKQEGKLNKDEKVTVDNLKKIGFNATDAATYATAYSANAGTTKLSQQSNVIDGFGSNGGEEFLSYMQTGESMIIAKDSTWTKWYDTMSGRMLSIQNSNGSWSGHHCITSPVFCTATSLLILSIQNDAEKLQSLGKSNSLSKK